MDTLTRMRAFIEVVEAEGFSAAARKIGRSKALLSKYVRELEDELGVLLLNRTTRQFSMTETGHTYYQRASEIIRDIDSLQDSVSETSGDARGRIKLSAPRTFADAPIGLSLIDFCAEHPDIVLDIRLDDRFVDLVEEGFDLAVRITRLQDSSLIAKRLTPFHLVLCASPELIAKVGMPDRPEGLHDRPCIIDTNAQSRNNWHFRNTDGSLLTVPVSGPIEVNSPLTTMAAAVKGLGFCILPRFIAEPELESGRLIAGLDEFTIKDGGIYAVYPHRRYLPAKVRVLVDYLAKWFKERNNS
ncbi:LysR family transcriptional regulator [Phyllobacterium phragmitis]|uniref:LysR family transcriptional regulator n=1 Tax=Phyllobacterium phragmitis TaxID=2670329 RepID=A0A2S9IQ95_9HYPH|nr:LysR family transcriptional regulator [Phyllobacterium phragmitis]PRD42703.1 LysR family transcriptional regulator [Phyllobacterium phragmitis]